MIRSMTGFGRHRETVNGLDITVEIRSVNSRFLDCNAKISRAYSYLEERVKPYLQSRGVSRGKVDVWIGIEVLDSRDVSLEIDETYLQGYLQVLGRLRDEYGLRDDISVMSVARNPELFRVRRAEENVDRDWQCVLPVLDRAVDMREKLDEMMRIMHEIERLSEADVAGYRERLAERIREALADNQIVPDESRLLTECAIFADKIAIDEEMVRLRTHFDAFSAMLSAEEPIGRKMDFLMQEMNREINTTGSKCNDAQIARHVVDVKCELEKIREQIQNLE